MRQFLLVLKIGFLRLRFILVFVVVFSVVGAWPLIMNIVDRWTRPTREVAVESEFEWFCPMHPTVIRTEPGSCPICGMPLSKRKRGEKEDLPQGVLARVSLSPLRIRQAGLRTVEVEHRPLHREIRSVGNIEYDEGRLTNLSSRIPGRADELYIKYVGTRVVVGDPIYKLYSPELVSTQREYLLALASLEKLHGQAGASADAVRQARQILESGRERLLLWGIREEQVAQLERDKVVQSHLVIRSPVSGVVVRKDLNAGGYVEQGDNPFVIADLSYVWMVAEVLERDIGLVRVGESMEITTEAYPGKTFQGVVALIEPSLRTDTRTVRVRADVANPDLELRPGMYVRAVLRAPLAPTGRAPYSCCLGTEEGAAPPCEKCEAAPVAPAPAEPRTVYICPGHKHFASDVEGICTDCGTMVLDPLTIDPADELLFACPAHPDVVQPGPGECPHGKHRKLEWRVVPRSAATGGHACPLHPEPTEAGGLACPGCGHEMKDGPPQPVLAIPLDAAIDTGERKVVYVDRGEGLFEAVEVVLGPRAGIWYPVLSGLSAGDRVVAAGSFLLDAEANLNPAAGAAYYGASGGSDSK